MVYDCTQYSFEAEVYKQEINYHIHTEDEIDNIISEALNSSQKKSSYDYIDGIIERDTFNRCGKLTYDFIKTLR